LSSRLHVVEGLVHLRTRARVLRLALVGVLAFALLATGGPFDGLGSTAGATPVAAAAAPNGPAVGVAVTPSGTGSWTAFSDGSVLARGGAPDFGSLAGMALSRPVVDIAATPSGAGYWMVASDGGIFSFGDAAFFGSTGAMRLNQPIVGMASTPSGRGYWLVASDGGIFSYGDAAFFGSTGAMRLNQPIVGMASTPSGRGYWMVASDGGIFSFGDAGFFGSTGAMTLNEPIVGMASTPTGIGYWMVAADGGIFSFGDAGFVGSSLSATRDGGGVAGMARRPGGGYVVVDGSGGLTDFSSNGAVTTTPPPTTPPPGGTSTPPPVPAPTAPVPVAGDVFVSSTGTGSGTLASPASITAVFARTVSVPAGRTVWLRGGTYTGRFRSQIAGTASARTTVRSYPGERAVINSPQGQSGDVLIIAGSYSDFRDLEVMMSDTNRTPWRDAGITVQGHHNRVINNYIHDTGCGITSFSAATDIEIYGNVILNVGSGNQSESCHSVYGANSSGTKLIEDNVWYGSGWFGLHLYTEGGGLNGFVVRGNVGTGPNIIGGLAPVNDLLVEGNDLEDLRVGYSADNGAVTIRGNRIGWQGSGTVFRVQRHYTSLTVTGNTIWGSSSDGVRFENPEGTAPSANTTWNGNTYYGTGFAFPTSPGAWPCCGVSFSAWKSAHPGWDTTATWNSGGAPNTVDVRANRYEAGRGMIVAHVVNGATTVQANPSAVLAPGARYEVRNAYNPTAAPVARGTWNGGSISLPSIMTPATPIGMAADTNPNPRTAVYLLYTVA
jgi:hypothetical protein